MTSLIRNPLTIVWALLTTVTVVSWLVSRDGGAAHQLNATVTIVVLLIAGLKAQLVIWHFMEVRRAPLWLKAVTGGWVIAVVAAMLGLYFTSG